MTLTYVVHQKINLRKQTLFNEAWLHDRICDDPSILGLGDVRVLDRERPIQGSGRLDILLLDDDNNRRYEVEIMLGATDASHIVRTIEYWDAERRRYPGYEHVAVVIAEDITARFLNVLSLMAGSIPLIAIQLDALRVEDSLLLNFIQVLDQTELRIDDTDGDGGGGEVDRKYWDTKAGAALMKVCDEVLTMINNCAKGRQDLNYLRGYIGLKANGVVRNFIHVAPKRTRKFTHIGFLNGNASNWKQRFEDAGVSVKSHKRRFRLTVTPDEFSNNGDLIQAAIADTVKEFDA